ncbi:MAG: dihydrodipicolinate reductase [Candidatus Lokiarchaeota archaeon]|nr:dihydrodipicolinate reductase [Candidatus Lokiarchaeota archaeon]
MHKPFEIIQVGLGPMGKIITSLLLKRQNILLRGVVDINPQLIDKKLSDLVDCDKDIDLIIESDLNAVLSREKADVVIIATSSSVEKIFPTIEKVVKSGIHVISICEELPYPFQYQAELSKKIDILAKDNNVTVVGTGINPGYLMDLLPIVLTAPLQSVNSIKVTRMMNSAKRRVPFQKKIGTGLSVSEFHRKINEKEITGHVGLTQSIQMIVTALGLKYDEIIELPPKEIITTKDFTTSYGETVQEGYVCRLQSKALAKKQEKEVITLDFVAYAGEHEEYDSISIEGIPSIEQKIRGGVHGDLGTSAMVANLIPKVITARPGLLTMKDLPVPCNTENIWKT